MAQRVSVNDGAAGSKRTSRVRVAVRLRPYMDKQDEKGEGPCVRGLGPQKLEIINWRNATETLQYHDLDFRQNIDFFCSISLTKPSIHSLNFFLFLPSGKTHTMLGSQEQPGIIPRAVKEVFKLVDVQEKEQDGWEYSVGMSYLELYNEKVLDLLSPGSQDLPIREDKDRNILIPGLTRTPLLSFTDFDTHFIPASLNRTTASTKLNQRSSRNSSVLDRLLALEKMMMGSAERERLNLLKTVAQSRKEIQMLKEKQKELEDKANMLNKQNETVEKESKDALLFKTDLPPLHRKPSTAAKPRKQQAVVTPLQVSQVQPLQQCAVVCKPSQFLDKKKKRIQTEVCEGKENGGVDRPSADDVNWESHLDSALLEQSRKKILQTLNSGSLKDLKSLQLIGDKKAKLIMGWREIHGDFTWLEDLKKIEGITAKRFSSFIKVCGLCQ
uniref:Kinesin-like protein KIF22 n=1 Tax=Sinocyclocheilus rhinocerous TaxID=307959 RepID=A0A673MW53_9TELE